MLRTNDAHAAEAAHRNRKRWLRAGLLTTAALAAALPTLAVAQSTPRMPAQV